MSSNSKLRRPAVLAVLVSIAGALVATALGFLTFGARATAGPHEVPVAVAAPEAGPLHAAAEKVATMGGERLSWQVTTPEQARALLQDKDVYGVLELSRGSGGPAAKVVVSGAVNPAGTQVAQQALSAAGGALTAAAHDRQPVQVETLHPGGPAGRAAPIGLSALAWVGSLAAGGLLIFLTSGAGARPGTGARLVQLGTTSVLVTGVLAGFIALWDSSLPLGWDVLGFLLLTVAAFAAVQGGLFRLLGVRAFAILGPLYLIAPSVAGQIPELLNPAYRALLWSWTPFRFSTEGLRSLLHGTQDAPDVSAGIWVLAAMLVAGLLVQLWPARRRSAGQQAEANPANGVVQVGVH